MNQNSDFWNKQILLAFDRKVGEQVFKKVNKVKLKKDKKGKVHEFKQKRLI